ncbi:MAG TPA: DivIVA domain-containing protein, partial [Tepidimicrobium sp.]|nr:DivIVA domain-containing protein [Tepidimicrobium sp.]
EFKRSFRGYNETDVDRFLDDIVESYENLYRENVELKDKIVALNEQIKRYNTLETTLKDTLLVAQSTADEVTAAARNKGQLIIEEAELKAREIISSADDEVKRIKEEYEHLKKEIFIFKTRYKSFIEAQLVTLDEFYSNIGIEDDDMDEKDLKPNKKLDKIDADKDIKDLGA